MEKLYCLIKNIKYEGKVETKAINKAIGHEMMQNLMLMKSVI